MCPQHPLVTLCQKIQIFYDGNNICRFPGGTWWHCDRVTWGLGLNSLVITILRFPFFCVSYQIRISDPFPPFVGFPLCLARMHLTFWWWERIRPLHTPSQLGTTTTTPKNLKRPLENSHCIIKNWHHRKIQERWPKLARLKHKNQYPYHIVENWQKKYFHHTHNYSHSQKYSFIFSINY